ncbi:MAG: TIGR03118 family protein [Acidobacteriales bacterium]|nr:TIGR03118 family protein [Terriglobales bacterium]
MSLRKTLTSTFATAAILMITIAALGLTASAQFTVTNLVSNQAGKASHQDTSLINAWGIAFSPTGPFWISDEGTGLSTLYTGAGVKQSLVVTVPTAGGTGTGSPTGMVYNATADFVVTQNGLSGASVFIFDTLDGTISGWAPSVNGTKAIVATTRPGAFYTGLAIGVSNGANFLYAADNVNNRIDVYDKNFALVNSFTDTNLPAGSNPYNVQNIGGMLYVAFTNSRGWGVVDIFDTAGNFVKTFATGGTLKSPWGLAKSPANFGKASNAILVGNLSDGRINVYNATTGKFLGQMKDKNNLFISISELWGLSFGAGNPMNGRTNQLFFTAGPNGYVNGLFGVITQ